MATLARTAGRDPSGDVERGGIDVSTSPPRTLTPVRFVAACRQHGITLTVAGATLRAEGCHGTAPPWPGFTDYLRRHKAELIELLTERPNGYPFTDAEGFLRRAPNHCRTPAGNDLYRVRRDGRWHYRPDSDELPSASLGEAALSQVRVAG